ncbi:hypothetical protein P7C71_g3851, partial [Lecanoromycetidae sp. Uapishka_2]
MASQAQTGPKKRTSFSGFPGGSASMFLDRSKAGIRGSTPDSEALASSDDEPDHLPRLRPVTSNPGPKPVRRASWLAETQQAPNRKGSLGGNGPFSPASPSSTVPSGDQAHWVNNNGSSTGTTIGRGHSTSTSFPWGNTIWNNDSQKGPPQRLTEVLPSPTTIVPPGSAGFYNEEPLRSPPIGHDNMLDSAIPFAIPLQPTLKTYRSQSYSVGQLDPETSGVSSTNYNGYGAYGRQRNGASIAGLQHRPSRPSMLGELNHDPSHLGQLREVEDDGESSNDSEAGTQLSTQARTIEQLAMENAMLRQAAAHQVEQTRTFNRVGTSIPSKNPRSTSQTYQQRMRDQVREESDFALYDVDDSDDPRVVRYEGLNGRRSMAYFSRDQALRPVDNHASSPSTTNMHQAYLQSQYGRPNSQHPGHTQSRPNQLLYMVTFKAQRADVFYVQEGTGLQVRKGDLVIVEADRGADLGTVASESIPFAEAKELKDKYMQEHYTWLMVFSRHGQNGTVAGPNPNGQPIASNSAIGGMGGSPSQIGVQELPSSELKPKMIKRLAQAHEIQTLRDKEGNEAKAKRVCQQKVVEHRLNMEILEAEFQMDWKKLTFYYFADEYINFNSLVTDLFKIYKTRIWMSAINPASFQTPVGGLQIPGSAAPSALNGDVENYVNRRQPRPQPTSTSPASTQAAAIFDHVWSSTRDGNVMNGMAYSQIYAQPFPSQGIDMRQLEQYPLEYRQGVQQMLNVQPPYISPGYNIPDLRHSSSFTSGPGDWNQAMRGLSLGP